MNDAIADELILDLWGAFPPLFRLIRRGWKKRSELGLSVYHYETVGLLSMQERMSMSQIRDLLGVAKSHLTPIIDGLAQQGLVRRIPDEHDRRVIHVSLTARGRKFMNVGKERARDDMKELLGGLATDDLKTLVASLKRLREVLSRSNTKEGER